jgi:hypothetical protein
VEQDPANLAPNTPYRISNLELASRLSFFLWSSIPDDELLDAATSGKLKSPAVLERQVRRMLADSRSRALVDNFADQWLYLRNLASANPDMRIFAGFDDNLRQAFRQETELFFASIMQEDRSVLDLLRANYTFVNERLAKHYGIPNVYGSRFRRVTFENGERGGLLRHSDGDLLRDPHVAGDSRQVDSLEHSRRAAAASAGHSSTAQGTHSGKGYHDARAAGRTPRQSGLRGLPQADGSGRLLDGELRCRWPLAQRRGWRADRCQRRSSRRQ